MNPYNPGPSEPPHQQATRSFMSGFAGCLGVGAAMLFVLIALLLAFRWR